MTSKRVGRPRKGELPDLGIYPADEDCYEPDLVDGTEKLNYKIILPEGHRAGIVQTFRVGTSRLLAFSLFQSLSFEGRWHPVMRIDSWHGTVHRHDFTRTGNNMRTILEAIPPDRAERTIERWCDQAEALMMEEWEDNVRRWHGDKE